MNIEFAIEIFISRYDVGFIEDRNLVINNLVLLLLRCSNSVYNNSQQHVSRQENDLMDG